MHFDHLAAGHLAANLLGYLLIVPLTYALSALSGRRAWFYAGFVTYLAVFPPVLSALNVLLVRPRIGLGFSGINMAFLGLLPLMLVSYVEVGLGTFDAEEHAPLLFFAGAALIGALTLPYSRTDGLAGGLAAVTAVAYARPLWAEPRSIGAAFRRAIGRPGAVELVCCGLVTFVAVLAAAFPPHPGRGGILNVYLHVLGYCLGFIVPYVAVRVGRLLDD
ncbi:MAG: hypothetical protein ABEJ28_11095 [Salinigranum sp.]